MITGAARSRRLRISLLTLLVAVLLALGACSPEDDRNFGAGKGSGADPDNYDTGLDLHGDEDRDDSIYHDTPQEPPGE